MKLQDSVAIVTGGSRGIGEAVVLAFAREGARVVVAARSADDLQQVAAAVLELGGEVEVVSADVSQPAEVTRLIQRALARFGQIDILVNAAGIYGPIGPLWESDVAEWTRAIQINLVGTFLCCHAVLPHMIERGRGKIVNFSGGGATAPLPRFSAYAASKAAVVRLTETLAERQDRSGLT